MSSVTMKPSQLCDVLLKKTSVLQKQTYTNNLLSLIYVIDIDKVRQIFFVFCWLL